MNTLETVLSQPIVERIGWTLIHFLWQGAALALLLGMALLVLRPKKANIRYLLACGCLALMVLLPVSTFLTIGHTDTGTHSLAQGGIIQAETISAETGPPSERSESNTSAEGGASRQSQTSLTRVSWLQGIAGKLSGILPWCVVVWMAGVFVLSLRLLGGSVYLARFTSRSAKLAESSWQDRLSDVARRMGITRSVLLAESALIHAPTLIGWLRAMVVVPTGMLAGLPSAQVDAILVHELAHVRRHDYLVNLFQLLAETILFYHPAVWWVSRRVRIEREHACDDLVIAVGEDPVEYAHALVQMERFRSKTLQLALAADGGSLQARIRRLLGPAVNTDRAPQLLQWTLCLILVLLMLIVGAGLRSGWAEDEAQVPVDEVGDLRDRIVRAIDGGDYDEAMELYCSVDVRRMRRHVPDLEFGAAQQKLLTSRYFEVFTPPMNADELYPMGGWKRFGPGFSFTSDDRFARRPGERQPGVERWCPPGEAGDPCNLVVRYYESPHVVVDLEPDGVPELVYDGDDVQLAEGLTVALDVSEDGHRSQWLANASGIDPRQKTQIWLYLDMLFFAVLIDLDGNGKGTCGRSGTIAPPGSVPPPSPKDCGERKSPEETKAEAVLALADAAERENDDAALLDLLDDVWDTGAMYFDFAFHQRVNEAMHRRYNSVFRPPSNADQLCPPTGWRAFGAMTAYGNWGGGEDGSAFLQVDDDASPYVVVDLNRDGSPELTYDGKEAAIVGEFSVAIDRAVDGRRIQWLISPPGIDPRERAQVWMLRDGRHVVVVVDTDGDGRGNCGRSTFLR